MIRRPPRSTQSRSSAASDMYTRDALMSLRNMNKSMMDGIRASSEPYALLKARVIREHLVADWGLSESGAAGPTGNKYGDKAGHCVLAVAGGIEKSLPQQNLW